MKVGKNRGDNCQSCEVPDSQESQGRSAVQFECISKVPKRTQGGTIMGDTIAMIVLVVGDMAGATITMNGVSLGLIGVSIDKREERG